MSFGRLHRRVKLRLAIEYFTGNERRRLSSAKCHWYSGVRPSTIPRCSVLFAKQWVRGATRSTKLKVGDLPSGTLQTETGDRNCALPQGLIDIEPEEANGEDAPVLPTLLQQVRNHMNKYEGSVLLTKVGQFYELYFEQAEEYGPLLGLKVASRKTSVGPVPMAGFQVPFWNRYVKILVQDLYKQVAIADEIPNDASERVKSGGLMFNREVKRIISPGTLIDENFISPFENNYLLAVHVHDAPRIISSEANSSTPSSEGFGADVPPIRVGLAWIDVTSGDFFTQSTNFNLLVSAIARIAPREIVLNQGIEDSHSNQVFSMLKRDGYPLSFQRTATEILPVSDWNSYLVTETPHVVVTTFTEEEIAAGSAVLHYVDTHLQGRNLKLKTPIRYRADSFMSIDKSTLRALEIRTTLRDGAYRGSLLHAVRRTVTPSGARLLNERLILPSLSLSTINERLNLVDEFLRYSSLHDNVVALLKRTYDTTRLVQKFSLGRGEADDLLSLAQSIAVMSQISAVLEDHIHCVDTEIRQDPLGNGTPSMSAVGSIFNPLKLEEPKKLAARILDAIDEEGLSASQRLEEDEAVEMAPLAQRVINTEAPGEQMKGFIRRDSLKIAGLKEGKDYLDNADEDVWIMRRSASSSLERLHEKLDDLWADKAGFEAKLRAELDAPSLTLRWTPGMGHHLHLKKRDVQNFTAKVVGARSVNSTKSTHSFHYTEWTDLGNRIDATRLQIRTEEQRVFKDLRQQVVLNLVKLRRNADVLDELDVACGFATLASERNYVRPMLTHSTTHKIYGGRHPMVEIGLTEQGRTFTSNNCLLGEDERVWLITGPNMAGKSTFLRQNALISILAQTGSFVPADYAEIGLVDRIFSRIGSADNLYEDQSTFMVEMLETAEILKQATSRSFVIMDEVGRGTTPEDGVAVGYASLHHLHNVNRCRALFATHFHVLADKTKDFEKLACYCNDVVEDAAGGFSYAHKMRKGVNRESHALKVARLAGLPEEAIRTAREELAKMKLLESG